MSGVPVRRRCEQRELGGAFLVDDGVNLHLLEGTAARIWRLVDGGRPRSAIVQAVCDGAAEPGCAATQVGQFLDRLVSVGLVVEDGGERFEVPAGTGWVETDLGGVALAVFGSGERLVLSPAASLVWELAATGRSQEQIVDALQVDLDGPPHDLVAVVGRTVGALLAAGVLRRAC